MRDRPDFICWRDGRSIFFFLSWWMSECWGWSHNSPIDSDLLCSFSSCRKGRPDPIPLSLIFSLLKKKSLSQAFPPSTLPKHSPHFHAFAQASPPPAMPFPSLPLTSPHRLTLPCPDATICRKPSHLSGGPSLVLSPSTLGRYQAVPTWENKLLDHLDSLVTSKVTQHTVRLPIFNEWVKGCPFFSASSHRVVGILFRAHLFQKGYLSSLNSYCPSCLWYPLWNMIIYYPALLSAHSCVSGLTESIVCC